MTIATTATWNPTRDELLRTSLSLCGELHAAKTPTAEQYDLGRRFLQTLLSDILNRGIVLQTKELYSQDLSAVTTTTPYFTVPSDTEWVDDGAIVRTTEGIDSPLLPWTDEQYNAIADKTITGRPSYYNARKGATSTTVYLWPVPDTATWTTLIYPRLRRFRDVDTGNVTLDLPIGFMHALTQGLAWMFALHYKRYGAAEKLREYYDDAIDRALENENPRARIVLEVEPLFGGLS